MSKMYQRYLELKKINPNQIYLFLADDAKKMASLLNLKLTNLNENVLKCGFPVNNLDKYLNLIKSLGYTIEIVDSVTSSPLPSKNYLLNTSVKNLIDSICLIKADELSIKEAYSLIDSLNLKAKKIKEEMNN